MRRKYIIAICMMLLVTHAVWAQTVHRSFRIHYIINIAEIDSTFQNNTESIAELKDYLKKIQNDTTIQVKSIRFRGTASPDGGYEFNQWLCVNRLRTFKELVRNYIDIPDSIIIANVSDIPWDGFRDKVAQSDIQYRDEILAIIDEGPKIVPWFNNRHIDARLLKLKSMHKGKVWELLKSPILEDLRFGSAVFETYQKLPLPPLSLFPLVPETPPFPSLQVEEPEYELWMPRLHLKTNTIGLALLSANFAVEADIARHWSVTLPVYYCAIDWFKSTIKFRNFTVQPEVRYWFRHADNDGFFVGAHLEMAYYNFAFDGAYRYQDYRGRTPALGGGLSVGYRKPISKNKRWRMEFTLGAGIYPLDYSTFHNTPDVRDGQWISRHKKTYVGLDQTAVTFAYSFDMKKYRKVTQKKGGRK